MMLYLLYFAQLFNPDDADIPKIVPDGNTVQTALNFFFGLIGVVAVLIITIAGFQYVISRGDPQRTAKAKDAILYAVIGLAVAILGGAIVNLIVGRVG